MPAKVARSLSNISQLAVCHRIGNQIYLIDPLTLSLADISSQAYWRAPFPPLVDITQAVEFIVLDIEPTSHPPKTAKGGRFLLADAQVSPVGGTMSSDTIFHCRTHLGAVLKPGDTVLGYMLANSNFNNDAWETLNQERMPEVVLIRKTYPARRKQKKPRNWKLQSMVRRPPFRVLSSRNSCRQLTRPSVATGQASRWFGARRRRHDRLWSRARRCQVEAIWSGTSCVSVTSREEGRGN